MKNAVCEMLGIDFPGHHNLRPLLLDDDVDEYPLRKSHQLVPIYADRPGIVAAVSRFVAEALGPAFAVLCALKNALDPVGILNPGKMGLPVPQQWQGATWL